MSLILLAYIGKYGYIAIFSLVFLQEIGVPNPVPNEVVLLFSGYLTSVGKLDFITVLLTVIAADTTGSSLLYMIFYWFGQRILPKWSHVIPTSKLAYLTARVAHQDRWSIYVGRLIPFIRGYTAVAAGLLKIPPGIFLPAVLLSALTWSGGYVIAGKLLGHEYANVVQKLGLGKAVLAGLALLCIIGFFGPRTYHWLKNKRLSPSGWSYAKDNGANNRE
jgi:membrane protein DedA with SNARE-associated domain